MIWMFASNYIVVKVMIWMFANNYIVEKDISVPGRC